MSLSSKKRLSNLRNNLAQAKVQGFLLPRGDEHMNEYVAPYAERLAWLTGFDGSAGFAIILPDKAALFSDGRYTLQMKKQTDSTLWETHHNGETPPAQWLKNYVANAPHSLISYDPWLMSETSLKPFVEAGINLIPLDRNPIDPLWSNQPSYPTAPALIHPLSYAGLDSQEKRKQIVNTIKKNAADTLLITDPTCIAWLLNIRGNDIPYTPVALSFALLHANGQLDLFGAKQKFPVSLQNWIGEHTQFYTLDQLGTIIATTLKARKVQLDPTTTALWFIRILKEIKADIIRAPDPCLIAKACKNTTEQEGARIAHLKDGVALCRFFHWLDSQDTDALTEWDAALKLNDFRKMDPDYREESFPAISASGANGAIIHYRATPENHDHLRKNTVFLLDSGGQYIQGTTDVTRTLWLGPDPAPANIKEMTTRVLKGHIALSSALFPENSPGHRLDSFARRPLWDCMEDFDHGTGHGVGSFLSVHEGPCRISSLASSVGLKEGMILSNEPGFYKTNEYGIRLENLILAQKVIKPHTSSSTIRPFLHWEVLTMVPFDTKLIDTGLLTKEEKTWLNTYHNTVWQALSPFLNSREEAWLAEACAPLA